MDQRGSATFGSSVEAVPATLLVLQEWCPRKVVELVGEVIDVWKQVCKCVAKCLCFA